MHRSLYSKSRGRAGSLRRFGQEGNLGTCPICLADEIQGGNADSRRRGPRRTPGRRVAVTPERRSPGSLRERLPAKRSRPEMAPQRLEKIESAPGNGMGSEASNLQDVVHGRAAGRARLRLTSRKNDEVAEKGALGPEIARCRTEIGACPPSEMWEIKRGSQSLGIPYLAEKLPGCVSPLPRAGFASSEARPRERLKRAGAMGKGERAVRGQAMLLRRRHLAESPRVAVGDEHRVIAEPGGPPGRIR